MDTRHETNSQENEHFAPEYRDRLRTWLVKMIDSTTIPGLCWENDEKTIFRMPWKHAGRQDYNLEEDSKIFMAWAKHSGRYREGIDRPEPIVWKTRLRCALNKMQDIKEIPSRSRLDISEPYRVYQLLPPIHKASQIRRRFYHRSHSQDVNPNQIIDQSGSATQNGKTWNKKLSDPGLANEASHLAGNASLLSGVSAIPPTGLWFPPSANMPLNVSLPSDLLQVSQTNPTSVDAISQLRSFAQGRYPLMTSLQAPFMPFPPTTLPSIFPPTSTGFEALKQLAFNNQTPVNGYMERIKAFEEEKKKQDHIKVLTQSMNETNDSFDYSTPSDVKEGSRRESVASVDREENKKTHNENNLRYPPEVHPLYIRLGESQRRIEALEQDLKKSRSAHAQEREAREQLEIEKETMQLRLARMSEGLRVLATHMHQPDGYGTHYTAAFKNEKSFQISEMKQVEASKPIEKARSVSPLKREALSLVDPRVSDNRSVRDVERLRKSSFQNNLRNENGKRCASPLDLTVPSPKRANFTDDDNENPFESANKSYSTPYNGVHLSSSPLRSLSSDDKRIMSPYSSASGSPETVGRSRSLSPIPSNSTYFPQHHQLRQLQVS